MKYNEQIKQGRKKAGMTQKALAEKVGVITRQIQFIEAGKASRTIRHWLKSARYWVFISFSPKKYSILFTCRL